MKDERKKLLAKLAYLYYVEDKSQSQIAAETGIYRTTVSRMLAEAKKEGVVKIEIENFDTRLFHLENYIKQKYGLKAIEIIPNLVDEPRESLEKRLAQASAVMLRNLIEDGMTVGFSWGKSLRLMVEQVGTKRLDGVQFYPLAGGPSHIHARYHVNTLIYSMAWFDMLTSNDFKKLESEHAVGEVCCRFFDQEGIPVYPELQERTISITLEELREVPNTISLAYGDQKAKALLSVLKANYINHLVTDEATILKVLELDGDQQFTKK